MASVRRIVAIATGIFVLCIPRAIVVHAQACTAASVFLTPVLSSGGCPSVLTYFAQDANGAAYTLATADFNGDGKLDLVVAFGYGDAELAVVFGNGDGTFQAPVYLLPNNDPNLRAAKFAIVGDFNGDGKPDIAAATTLGYVTILVNNGNGTFSNGSIFPAPGTPGGNAQAGAVGDFNGDGKLDLVITSNVTNPGIAIVYWGNGDGTVQTSGPNFTIDKITPNSCQRRWWRQRVHQQRQESWRLGALRWRHCAGESHQHHGWFIAALGRRRRLQR